MKVTLYPILMLALLFLTHCRPEELIEEEEPKDQMTLDITQIPAVDNGQSYELNGSIDDGVLMEDLSWAALSNVACFPGTRFVEFMGKQVYYQVDIPQGNELIATVTPTGERRRINIYGYIDFDGSNLPPLTSILSCEAGYELYAGTTDFSKPGEPQSISFAQAVNKGFTAFVAVSGAENVLEGDFNLKFELRPM